MSIVHATITVYYVLGERLDSLTYINSSNGVFLAVAGLFAGSFITFLTTLLVTDFKDSPVVHGAFVTGCVISIVLTAIFSWLFCSGVSKAARDIEKIRETKTTTTITIMPPSQ